MSRRNGDCGGRFEVVVGHCQSIFGGMAVGVVETCRRLSIAVEVLVAVGEGVD